MHARRIHSDDIEDRFRHAYMAQAMLPTEPIRFRRGAPYIVIAPAEVIRTLRSERDCNRIIRQSIRNIYEVFEQAKPDSDTDVISLLLGTYLLLDIGCRGEMNVSWNKFCILQHELKERESYLRRAQYPIIVQCFHHCSVYYRERLLILGNILQCILVWFQLVKPGEDIDDDDLERFRVNILGVLPSIAKSLPSKKEEALNQNTDDMVMAIL